MPFFYANDMCELYFSRRRLKTHIFLRHELINLFRMVIAPLFFVFLSWILIYLVKVIVFHVRIVSVFKYCRRSFIIFLKYMIQILNTLTKNYFLQQFQICIEFQHWMSWTCPDPWGLPIVGSVHELHEQSHGEKLLLLSLTFCFPHFRSLKIIIHGHKYGKGSLQFVFFFFLICDFYCKLVFFYNLPFIALLAPIPVALILNLEEAEKLRQNGQSIFGKVYAIPMTSTSTKVGLLQATLYAEFNPKIKQKRKHTLPSQKRKTRNPITIQIAGQKTRSV